MQKTAFFYLSYEYFNQKYIKDLDILIKNTGNLTRKPIFFLYRYNLMDTFV